MMLILNDGFRRLIKIMDVILKDVMCLIDVLSICDFSICGLRERFLKVSLIISTIEMSLKRK
jgi:hypothetical protein